MNLALNRNLETTPPALREVSLLIAEVNGINLGQGICKLPAPEIVVEAAKGALDQGEHRYSPANGVPRLRSAIQGKLKQFNGLELEPEQLLVSPGSTGAFEAVCQTLLEPGDHVISFRPFYPYHHNALRRAAVDISYIDLETPDWSYDFSKLQEAVTERTKFILVNTPNNPTGKVFTKKELEEIAELCIENDLCCVSDEVYEYMTYEDRVHISPASLPALRDKTITMGSYSKTFSITGWRIGYLAAPLSLAEPIRNALDQLYVCAPTPLQHGVAAGIEQLGTEYYNGLKELYSAKRKLLTDVLAEAGFEPIAPQGAYYILTDIRKKFPGVSSEDAIKSLIQQCGVGAVPASDFLGQEVKLDAEKSWFLRWCFAIPDQELEQVAERLKAL
jgi:aminotransferase